ncbi:MAG: ribonuclease HI family protein [bacterium]
MKGSDKIILHSDGASLGNPGKAGIGVIISDQDGKVIKRIAKFIGVTTNNVAEYMALIFALEEALYLRAKEVECFLDSQLLVRQLEGTYRVKDTKLGLFHSQVRHLESFFEKVNFNYVVRSANKQADKLAKVAARGKRE